MEEIKTKICSKCGIEKPITEFGKSSKTKDGIRWDCKQCKAKYYQDNKEYIKKQKSEYVKSNKEKISKRRRIYYDNHKQHIYEYQEKYRKIHKEYMKKQQKNARLLTRLEVLNHYSNGTMRCSCGEDHIEFLEIDHINGGGRKHAVIRKLVIYNWLKKNNYPEGYQVLCSNCNAKKVKNEARKKRENGSKNQRYTYKYDQKLKKEVFSHYMTDGKIKCSCPGCNVDDIDILCLDHKNNDGAEHRKNNDLKGGRSTYIWVKRNNYPNTFRILCHNCNQSIGNRGYCPHEKELNNS